MQGGFGRVGNDPQPHVVTGPAHRAGDGRTVLVECSAPAHRFGTRARRLVGVRVWEAFFTRMFLIK